MLDVDDTEAPVHGGQELARFDGYYGGYCFLPFHVYEGLSGRLITTMLKAKRFTGAQMLSVLKRLVKRLRHAWPDTLLILRGDSHCCLPRGDAVGRSAARAALCDGFDEQCRLEGTGSRGGRASHAGLCALGSHGHPLSLDALPGPDVVAPAPRGASRSKSPSKVSTRVLS